MWKVYEYIDPRGERELTDWNLQVEFRAKLEQKMDMLQTAGPELPPNLLAPLGDSLFKLKVHGKVQLRPILCQGPIEHGGEFTFLVRAEERDNRLIPANAVEIAKRRRAEVVQSPNERRAEWDAE